MSPIRRTEAIVLAGAIGTVACFAVLAWQQRWIADDGLIAVRTVRELLGGHGPVFNAYERAEANTSTLWTYLLAIAAFVTRANVTRLAVLLGMALAIGGVAIGYVATLQWHRRRGVAGVVVPFGVLVVLCGTGFREYASSGLETGLSFCWLASCWWLLVQRPASLGAAIVFGLGPLVRPDFALATMTFLVVAYLLERPPLRRVLVLLAAAGALPVLYEVFRAGYYGVLVPLPALAKSASHADWHRGLLYLYDVWRAYRLLWVVPVLVAVAVLARLERRDRVLAAAPVVAGLLMTLYVVRVGGDFMRARMLLPPLFAVVLPAFVLPVSRRTAVPLAIFALWTVKMCAGRTVHTRDILIEDERRGYSLFTGVEHPDSDAAYLHAVDYLVRALADAHAEGRHLMITEGAIPLWLSPRFPSAVIMGRLGTGGLLVPADGVDVDTLGLANPIGARIPINYPGEKPGHQKVLPHAWIVADIGDPEHDEDQHIAPPRDVRAARRAMACGDLAELLASVREPMSPSRFWHNLTGSVARMRLVIPSDPIEAEKKFCGRTTVPTVTVSSACEQWGWSLRNLLDGYRISLGNPLGYSSAIPNPTDHTEWIELELPPPATASTIVLYPRTDEPGFGFPIDFTIDVWDGHAWQTRVTEHDVPRPTTPQSYSLGAPASRVRLVATHLQDVPTDHYALQLTEIELRP